MKKNLRILKNEYLYSIVTKMFSIIIGMIQSILVARYLGSALQGTASYIASIISIGSIVITFGLHQAYPYFRKKRGKDAVYVDFVSVIYVLFAMYMIIASIVAFLFISSRELQAAVLLIPIYGYDRVVAYICLIEDPNKRNSIWTTVSVLDIVYVIFISLFWKRNLSVAISILGFAEIVKSIIYTYVLKVKPNYHRGLIKISLELLKFGFLPMVALLMTTLNYKVDILMLRSFEFISASQIGIYSIGMTFADKIVLLPDTLKGVLVSKLSKGADENEVAKVSRICFWSSSLICIVFLLFGQLFIDILYGSEYDGAYQILFICAIGSVFVGYFKLIAQYNIVNGKQVRNVALLCISVFVNIFLNYMLIPKYELVGAAIASGIGYFLSGIVFIIWFTRQNNIEFHKMFIVQKSDFKYLKDRFNKDRAH